MSKNQKVAKTNAMRALDAQHINYEYTAYASDGFMDGVSVAQAVGKAPETVFKTLVTIGMKKLFPTVIDDSAQALAEITVSAGKLGLQITLAPQDLAQVCTAQFAQLTV